MVLLKLFSFPNMAAYRGTLYSYPICTWVVFVKAYLYSSLDKNLQEHTTAPPCVRET